MAETEKREPNQEGNGEKILNNLLIREIPENEKRKIEDLKIANIIDPTNPQPFSEIWRAVSKETSKIFREKISGKLLIDLGGANGLMGSILQEEGVAVEGYINVDKYHDMAWDSLVPKTKNGNFPFLEKDNTINVWADMLDFLQNVSDGSVDAISVNGIDLSVIADDDYHKELFKQITRVLKPDGIVFGLHSEVVSMLADDSNFSTKWKWGSKENLTAAILEKK